MPRISDVEVMARLLIDLGAEVEGIGTPTLRVRCQSDKGRAGRRARREATRLGAPARSAAGAAGPGESRAAGRRLPGAPQHRHASRCARGDGRAGSRGSRARARRPGRSEAGVDLSVRASVTGTETALLAAAAAPGRVGDPSRRLRTACRRVVRVSPEDGRRRSPARARRTIRIDGSEQAHGAAHRLSGDYIEAGSWAVVAAVTGGEIEVQRRRARTWKWSPRC